MSCTRCGALINLGSKFCPACGKAVPPEPAAAFAATGGQPAVGMAGFVPAPQLLPPPVEAAPAQKSTNGLAIASMVLGIVWIYWIGSILALIFGYIAKGQIDGSQGRQGGRGMAIAGIVLGWVGIGFLLLAVVAVIVSKPH
jgi:hypothetical protein